MDSGTITEPAEGSEPVEEEPQQQQASEYEVQEATEKMKHAWVQMMGSLMTLSSRMDQLDSSMNRVMDDLKNCHDQLQKKLLNC